MLTKNQRHCRGDERKSVDPLISEEEWDKLILLEGETREDRLERLKERARKTAHTRDCNIELWFEEENTPFGFDNVDAYVGMFEENGLDLRHGMELFETETAYFDALEKMTVKSFRDFVKSIFREQRRV